MPGLSSERNMSMRKSPYWADDGLLVHRNATVYVCDADDTQAGGFDVHLDVSEDGTLDHIMFDNTATLFNRVTLAEAWDDAAGWLYETANVLMELRNYILGNEIGHESDGEGE